MTTDAHPDAPARARIRESLDETLFVEAGAGSGKTSALVDRVLALVLDGGIPLATIAAITFTEKAATELRDRIRQKLDERFAEARAAGDDTTATHVRVALDELDGAAIGTLHSFAQRILSEHPVEAGLPPRIEVLDEVTSMIDFESRWTDLLDELLDNPDMARPVLLLTSTGVRIPALREIALSFNQNWDLVLDHAPVKADPVPEWEHNLPPLLAEVDSITDERRHCEADEDTLLSLLDELADWAHQLRQAPDESARLALIRVEGGRPNRSPNGKGRKEHWTACDRDSLRARIIAVQERCEELANEIAHAALVRVAVELRRFTLDAAEERRREGRLEFHDLLVMARQMLRNPASGPVVRAALAQRYQRLLIDEFQDADPIQVELAVLVATDAPRASTEAWQAAQPAPGRLFFVGDPKQSIYRFRRADIALFLEVAERFGGQGRLSLTTNHRSGTGVLDWINHVFGHLIVPGDPAASTPRSQPDYEPLVAVRPDAPAGAVVSVMGRNAHDAKTRADALRVREAADVAASIVRILSEGWLIDCSSDWEQPDWQPARAGDIAILVPTRQPLEFLEPALVDAGIAYRMESSSLVYGSRPIRDLFLTLHAIDDPSDELKTVAALRSALFGCGDDDLFAFRELHEGRFDFTQGQPETVPDDDPVARALAYLREVHEGRGWRTPSELVDQVVRDRRMLEMGDGEGRARDLWQRVRAVVDQARAWTDATNGNLRQYLAWVRHQSAPGSRVPEAVLPETDDDAVRIMTIHAAKGLQFPVTIVAGLSTKPQERPSPAQVVWPPDGGCILNVGKRVTSSAFEAWRPLDEQMSHDERIRLLYVACTRARDHLVVSLHRADRIKPADSPTRMTNAELLLAGIADRLEALPDAVADEARPSLPATPQPAPDMPLPPFDEWQRERTAALARSGIPRTVAATALTDDGRPDSESTRLGQLALFPDARSQPLAEQLPVPAGDDTTPGDTQAPGGPMPQAVDPGLQKRPGDLDRPPWRKGRYGTAVGRAVHGVLQVIDLATGEGVDAATAAQAAAEGLVGSEPHIRDLVAAALQAPSVVTAAAGAHWREVHVAVPLSGDRTLEGYVDLLYRRDDGLVVVDYKTGPEHPTDEQLGSLVEGYRLQGASYALAVAEATGDPVVEMTFVFLTPTGPIERQLPGLAAAVTETRALIEAGRFAMTD